MQLPPPRPTSPQVCAGTNSVTVVITDECPDCTANQLNLHAFAFQQIANLEYGGASIQYRQARRRPDQGSVPSLL